MTPFRFAAALVASIICIGVTSAKEISPAVEARDPGVGRWIWYQVLGPRNSPFTIVYFSTRRFTTTMGEHLIVLPLHRYDLISAYTQSRLARSDCPGEFPAGNIWYTVQIAEHNKGQTRQCILPKKMACDYLSGVVKLRGINWSAKEIQPIVGFMAQIKCKIRADERARAGVGIPGFVEWRQ
jgi:hypothetical protein